jgi:acyl-coenzyme A thioesterase PaaI-like protein
MSLIADVLSQTRKTDLTGLEQLRALMASGQRPGIADSLEFSLTEVDVGLAVFQGTPGQHAYNPIGMVHGATPRHCSIPLADARFIRA